MTTKIEIFQAKSENGNVNLIHKFNDGNILPSFEIYKLVYTTKDVAVDLEFQRIDLVVRLNSILEKFIRK
jgi:hypothetical protein